MLIIISANNTFKYERVKQDTSHGNLTTIKGRPITTACAVPKADRPSAGLFFALRCTFRTQRTFLLVNWSSRSTMAAAAVVVLYSGPCCVALFFVSRATARSFERGPRSRTRPRPFRKYNVLRAAKRNFVSRRGNFESFESHTFYPSEPR